MVMRTKFRLLRTHEGAFISLWHVSSIRPMNVDESDALISKIANNIALKVTMTNGETYTVLTSENSHGDADAAFSDILMSWVDIHNE